MTYMGPSTQSYNFSYMYDQQDLRGPAPNPRGCENSMMNVIQDHPYLNHFSTILKKAKLESHYGQPQADFTLFVPDERYMQLDPSFYENMDDSTARHIVRSSTLKRRITSDLLKDSPASYFITMDPPNRLFVMNINGETILSNCSEAYGCSDIKLLQTDILCSNGIIHIVSGLLAPYETVQIY